MSRSKRFSPASFRSGDLRWVDATLLIVPMVVVAYAIRIYEMNAPVFAGLVFDYDPTYCYLIQSLSLLNGFTLSYADHPGTPVIVLGTLPIPILWLGAHWFAGSSQSLDQFVLAHAELVIRVISYAFLALTAVTILVLGHWVKRSTGSTPAALLIQASPLCLGSDFLHIVSINGEILAIPAALGFLALVIRELTRTEPPAEGERAPVIAGLLCGVAITSKITFAPFAALLLLFGPRERIRRAFVAIAAVVLACLAISWRKIPGKAVWWYGLLTHKDVYGTGAPGFVEWSAIPHRLLDLGTRFPATAVALAVLMLCVAMALARADWRRARWHDPELFALLLLAAVMAVQLAMVLKHYRTHYLIPTLVLTPSALFLSVRSQRERLSMRATQAIYAVSLIGISVTFLLAQHATLSYMERNSAERTRTLSAYDAVIARFHDPIVIGAYRLHQQDYAERFGFAYTMPEAAAYMTAKDHVNISYYRWENAFSVEGVGLRGGQYILALAAKARPVLLLMPSDVAVPRLPATLVATLPDQVRVLHVLSPNDPPR